MPEHPFVRHGEVENSMVPQFSYSIVISSVWIISCHWLLIGFYKTFWNFATFIF